MQKSRSAQSRQPLRVLGLPLSPKKGDLSPSLCALLSSADRICAFPSTLRLFHALDLPFRGVFEELKLPLEPRVRQLKERAAEGETIVLLASGDPLFFGLGASLAPFCTPDELLILPAQSALQLACARLNLPWHNVHTVSLHGRNETAALDCALMKGTAICLLLDPAHPPSFVARYLMDKGCLNYDLHVLRHLGSPEEEHCVLNIETFEDVPHELTQEEEDTRQSPTTLLLLPRGAVQTPVLGCAEEHVYDSDYTSALCVRATALSLLTIHPSDTVWDVGSGSGAVAIEASALAREGQIFAVEKRRDRAEQIASAIRRAAAHNVTLCPGHAPEALAALPDPDRVFLGGGLSGEMFQPILDCVTTRLASHGRMVVSCVLLSTLARLRSYFDRRAWPYSLLQLAASQAQPLASDLYFKAGNPVVLLMTEKPGQEGLVPFSAQHKPTKQNAPL